MTLRTIKTNLFIGFLLIILTGSNQGFSAASIEGELTVWYPVTLTFTGKQASETESTFRDHRLDVTFSNGDKSIRVPGYFAADGSAAESSATNGNKWRVKFTPNEAGVWNYKAGHKWVISEDESWPIDENQIDRAENYAWQVMTAGAEGMDLYIGYKDPSYNDIGLEDFSRTKNTLDYIISPAALLALPQVNKHLPKMASADSLVENEGKNEPPFCFAKEGSVYLV